MGIRRRPIAASSLPMANIVKVCQARRVRIRKPRHRHTASLTSIKKQGAIAANPAMAISCRCSQDADRLINRQFAAHNR
jgi:hypothetical protein